MYTGLNNLGLTGLATSFSPSNLFTNGEGGAHFETYDPQSLLRRRNQLTYSSQFANAAWTRMNILSVTENADGVGDLVVPNTTSGPHYLSQTSATVGAPNTVVVRAKAGGYSYLCVQIGFSGAAYFNLGTGAVGTISGATYTASIASAPDAPGYYDCTVIRTDAPTNQVFVFATSADGSVSFTGDGTSGIYLARAQLEWNTTTPSAYQEVTDWNTEYLAAALESIGMWQDSTGTTPVTAVEQPVGLCLDGKAGKWTRGAELVTNGDNEAALYVAGTKSLANVTESRDSAAPGGGAAAKYTSSVATAAIHQVTLAGTVRVPAGAAFEVRGRFYVPTGGISTFRVYDNDDGSWFGVSNTTKDGWVDFRAIRPPKASAWSLGIGNSIADTIPSGSIAFYIDDLSIKLFSGNHASQSGGTKRPLLSARVNLLTKTEQLDDPVWIKYVAGTGVLPVVTPNAGTDPLGGNTADRVVLNRGAGNTTSDYAVLQQMISGSVSGTKYDGAIYLRSYTGATQNALVYINSGAEVQSVLVSVGNSWTRVAPDTLTASVSNIAISVATRGGAFSPTALYGGDATLDLLVWGADIRTADDAAKNIPAYQRVNTSTDYDTVGFPHYLKFDGVDDSLQTGSIDLTSFDKISVWAGSTKGSDSAASVLTEFTATSSTTAGSFAIFAPDSAASTYAFRSRGATLGTNAIASGYAAPNSYVVTGLGDISGDLQDIRIDGASANTSTTDQGTGNFANDALNIGSRNNASLFHNGRLYSLTVRASTTPTSESAISSMNRYAGNLMKISF